MNSFEDAALGHVIRSPERVVQVVPSRFVTIELAATMTGLSPGAIRTKISKAIWQEGRQFMRRDGRIFVDLKGYERWVESGMA